MADLLVSALVNTMVEKLTTRLMGEFATFGDMRTKLENLRSTLTTIKAVLKDAEEKQWKSEAVKDWLRKLKDAAYDVDDVLDEFATEDRLRRLPADLKKRVRSFFSFRMAKRLKSVCEKLDSIANEKNKFHLKDGCRDNEVDSLDWRKTSSLVNETEIIGRDKEKEGIITMLLSDLGDVSFYAICGMGGLGKSTLAQVVYNDKRVETHFHLRMWICVSVDFQVERLTRAILESIEGSSCTIQELDPLQRRLQEKLSGKRFLLIMDDVWDEDNHRWDQLKNALRCGANGSAVMVTTRIEKVALMMATTPVHHLGRLSDDNSWSLFEQRAFGTDGSEEFAELKTIGKSIVKKCGGVPLAIKALASMMRFKRKESEWLSIKGSAVWDSMDEGNKILPALRLSYDNLSPHLRQCFAFCSVFPKDYVMEKDQLIELWMANEFIPLNRPTDLHDMGDAIFNELVWRSFFQEVSEDSQGDITCKMHDLLHDLAQLITVEECYLIEPNKVKVPRKVRHLAVCNTTEQIVNLWNENFFGVKSLRSLLLLQYDYRWSGFHLSSIVRQRHLRSLTFHHFEFEKFPVSITNLKHLRHLDVSYSKIKTLPEATTRLQNLQTLNLRDCWGLIKLPRGMKHMKNLIHLDIRRCNALTSMPARMGQLTCLRKLSIFIVGNHNDHSLKELNGLNLAGELSIKDLGNVKSYQDSRSANLMSKRDLQSLSLSWTRDAGNTNSPENFEEVLRGLQPHSNLKKLEINGYRGSEFPNWMMDSSLPNVVQISLADNLCQHLPPLGKLPFLKHLSLCGMDAVKTIDSTTFGDGDNLFPSLESLKFKRMRCLEDWKMVDGRNNFPCLGKLTVSHCPKLVELPIIPSVKTLKIEATNVTLLESVRCYTFLTSLWIGNFHELTVLPDGLLQNHTLLESLDFCGLSNLKSLSNQFGNLCALKHLRVQCCMKLESILGGHQNLVSLESLLICDCGLISFPTDGFCGLPSVHELYIFHGHNFTSLAHGMQCLTALEVLDFFGCPKLNLSPESIQHLTALRRLRILYCEGLSSLPDEIRYLRSLSYLEICGCRNLISLPEGIRSLNTLIELEITRCSHLERRCKKERGDDWPKIAHITKITINYRLIQSLASQ